MKCFDKLCDYYEKELFNHCELYDFADSKGCTYRENKIEGIKQFITEVEKRAEDKKGRTGGYCTAMKEIFKEWSGE